MSRSKNNAGKVAAAIALVVIGILLMAFVSPGAIGAVVLVAGILLVFAAGYTPH